MFIEGEEIILDRPVEDLTGTVCQPGTYVIIESETGWYDRETGTGDSAWVLMFPVTTTEAQAQFFGEHFPERYTFDPGHVLTASEEGRKWLADQERAEQEMAEAWAREDEREAEVA